MKNNIKKITIVFENCEYFDLAPEEVKNLALNNVENHVYKLQDTLVSIQSPERVFIELKKIADHEYKTLGEKTSEISTFQRIMLSNDITQIEIETEDNTFEYSLPWEDEDKSGMTNLLQISQLNEEGNLIIVIKKKDAP